MGGCISKTSQTKVSIIKQPADVAKLIIERHKISSRQLKKFTIFRKNKSIEIDEEILNEKDKNVKK